MWEELSILRGLSTHSVFGCWDYGCCAAVRELNVWFEGRPCAQKDWGQNGDDSLKEPFWMWVTLRAGLENVSALGPGRYQAVMGRHSARPSLGMRRTCEGGDCSNHHSLAVDPAICDQAGIGAQGYQCRDFQEI
jgi:hypothetical protein